MFSNVFLYRKKKEQTINYYWCNVGETLNNVCFFSIWKSIGVIGHVLADPCRPWDRQSMVLDADALFFQDKY